MTQENIFEEIKLTRAVVQDAVAKVRETLVLIKTLSDKDVRLSAADSLYESFYTMEDVASNLRDTINRLRQPKFIMLMDPDHMLYLEWVSNEMRMHKAQIMRDSIDEVMRKDKLYQKHLKTQKK